MSGDGVERSPTNLLYISGIIVCAVSLVFLASRTSQIRDQGRPSVISFLALRSEVEYVY